MYRWFSNCKKAIESEKQYTTDFQPEYKQSIAKSHKKDNIFDFYRIGNNVLITVILTIIAMACLALLRSEWEKTHPKAEFYSFGKGQQHFRIAYIADCHGNFLNGKVVDIIKQQKPDAIFIGGDIITCWKYRDLKSGVDEAKEFLRELCEIAPVVLSEGNHESRFERRFPKDYMDFTDELKKFGVLYLKNEKTAFDIYQYGNDAASSISSENKQDTTSLGIFSKENEKALLNNSGNGTDVSTGKSLTGGDKADIKRIAVYGLSMDKLYFDNNKPQLFAKREEMSENYIFQKVGQPEENAFNILFMHTPLYAHKAADWGADLVISAHFHGGTIWLGKYLGGLMTPQYGFFVRECQGTFRTNKGRLNFADKKGNVLLNKDDAETYLLVNRGIGTHSIKIRFMDRPEISIIDINV